MNSIPINNKNADAIKDALLDAGFLSLDWEIGGIVDPVANIANLIISSIDGFLTSVESAIIGALSNTINSAIGGISAAINNISGGFNSIIAAVNNLPSQISGTLASLGSQISGVINQISGILASSISQIISQVQGGFSQVSSAIGSIASQVSSSLNSIVSQLSGMLNGIVSSVQSGINSLGSIFAAALAQLGASIQGGLNQVGGFLTTLGGQIQTGFNSLVGQISGTLQAFAATVSADIGQVTQFLNTLGGQITQGFNTLVGQLTQDLNNLIGQVNTALGKIQLPDFKGLLSFLEAFGADPIGTIIKAVTPALDSVLKAFGLPTVEDIQKVIGNVQTDIANIAKFFEGEFLSFIQNPSKFITDLLDSALKAIGFPTIEDIGKAIEDKLASVFTLDNLLKLLGIPKDIENIFVSFIEDAAKVFSWATTAHSPTPLENLSSIFSSAAKISTAPTSGTAADQKAPPLILNPVTPYATRNAAYLAEYGNFNIWSWNSLFDFLNTMGAKILGGLQTFATDVSKGFDSLANYIIDGAVKTFSLPAPDAKATNPFAKLQSIFFKQFQAIAKMSNTQSPVVTEMVLNVVDAVSGATLVSEVMEWAGVAVDAAHPLKKLQIKDKIKDFFSKIGLGHVSGIIGATLVAASLHPVMTRFWNKQSQVQLLGIGELNSMEHRGLIKPEDLDIYLQEHGLDKLFRQGATELAHPLLNAQIAASAYFRLIAFENFDAGKAVIQLQTLFGMQGYADAKRKGFDFADTQLLSKLIYDLPSRFILRSMWMTGQLKTSDLEQLFTAGGMMPSFVKPAAAATALQGQLPFLKAQEAAFVTMVQHGFETGDTLTTLLKKINYPDSFITPTVAAAQLKADEEVNVLQVSEYDKQYTEGYMTKDKYVEAVKPLFKNQKIYAIHQSIVDLAVQRTTDNRIRTASDRAISQELIAFAEGAVSAADFEAVCKAGGKTADEIKALEKARQIIYANMLRIKKFRTYQTALAKQNIDTTTFETLCTALPVDAAYMKAAEQFILVNLIPKPKLTKDQVAALLAQAQLQLVTPAPVAGATTTP